jgi:hypothetical protein
MDTGLSGTAAESVLNEWMQTWLPTRVSVLKGAILATNTAPTTQRDWVMFDRVDTPVFYQLGESFLLPIEGVLIQGN